MVLCGFEFLASCDDVMLLLSFATPESNTVHHATLRLGWSRGTLESCACQTNLRGNLGDFVMSPLDLNVLLFVTVSFVGF